MVCFLDFWITRRIRGYWMSSFLVVGPAGVEMRRR